MRNSNLRHPILLICKKQIWLLLVIRHKQFALHKCTFDMAATKSTQSTQSNRASFRHRRGTVIGAGKES